MKNPSSDILPTKDALSGGAYMFLGRGLAFLASLAVVTVMGASVPRDVAGSYTFIMATLTILSIATLPGMNQALSRAIAQGFEGSVHPMIRLRLRWGLVGSAGALAIATYCFIQGNMPLGWVFLVAAPFIPLTDTFSNATFAYWQGRKRFTASGLMTFSYYALLAALSIPVFLLTDNLLVIVLSILAAQTIAGLAVFLGIVAKTGNEPEGSSIKLGFHLTAMQALQIVAGNADRVIVWSLLGPAMTAVYTFASLPIIKAWQLVPIGVVSLPHLSGHALTSEVKDAVIRKTFLLLLISVPVTVLVILLAPTAYRIVFPLYPDSIRYFQLLAIPLAFSPVLLLKSALTAFGKTRTLYMTEIASPIVKVLFMVIGGILSGLSGIAIGIIAASIIDFGLASVLFSKVQASDT